MGSSRGASMTAANQLLRFERGELEAIMGLQQRSTQKQNFYFSAVDDYPAHQLAQLFPDARPLRFVGDRPTSKTTDTAILCLHGFTAMPYGVRPIAEQCARAGFDTYAPVLPGHGWQDPQQQRREFPKITMEKLLTAARIEVTKLRSRYKKVYAYGDSMGGALSFALASEGLVDACAATAPALKLPFRGEVLSRYFGWLNVNVPKHISQRFYAPCYEFENARAGRALWEVSRYTRDRLDQVSCLVFIAHSRNDPTIPAEATEMAQNRCKGPLEVQWFDLSGHVLPLDIQGPEVSEAITDFFKSLKL